MEERETAARAFDRRKHRVMWQCVALAFLGVPLYALGWGLGNARLAHLSAAFGFFVSYAMPFFRWLAYHVAESEEFAN